MSPEMRLAINIVAGFGTVVVLATLALAIWATWFGRWKTDAEVKSKYGKIKKRDEHEWAVADKKHPAL